MGLNLHRVDKKKQRLLMRVQPEMQPIEKNIITLRESK